MTSNLSPSCQRVPGAVCLVRMVASLMNCSTEAFILGVILPHPPPSEAVFDFETISVHFRVVTRSPTWSFSSDRNVLEWQSLGSISGLSGRHRCQSTNWHLGSLKEGIFWYYRTLPCMLPSVQLRWFLLCLNMCRSGSRSGRVCPQ